MKDIGLIGYMIIGGVIMGFVDRTSMQECGQHIPFVDLTTGIIAWPGVVTAAFITTSNGVLCEDGQKTEQEPETPEAQ